MSFNYFNFSLGNFQNEFKWLEFLALACSDLSPVNKIITLKHLKFYDVLS